MRNLLGCALLACVATVLPAQTLTTLFRFFAADGADPYGGVIQGLDGNFYGTTYWNGVDAKYQGTVFQVTPNGQLTTLHAFTVTDGSNPETGLLLATNGAMYGTTSTGGATSPSCGTLFAITERGQFTSLHDFQPSEGEFPQAPLIQATNGNLYGANAGVTDINYGALYRATLTGEVTLLHTFSASDGANPNGLIQATDGKLYGTTQTGGAYGDGTIFRMSAKGDLTTVYSFTGGSDSGCPTTALVEATDGNFYGTTDGCYTNVGTIFRISPGGAFTTLHTFTGGSDGGRPGGALIQATDGNLYGSTYEGGVGGSCYVGCGTIFRMTLDGLLTTLFNFDGTDGSAPFGALIQATDGNLYGATNSGGPYNRDPAGTIFRLSVGLGPFVKTLPTSGYAGDTVRILGTNLTGASVVMFNGTPATFTVNSSGSAILTTVPTGATTGTVTVTIPRGTLSSNLPFVVR